MTIQNKIDSAHDTILDFSDYKITFGKLPIGSITICDDEKRYTYNPKEDITVYELSRIIQLFFTISAAKSYNYDSISFVKEHKLERHFDEVVT